MRLCATQAAGPQTKTALAQFEVGGFDFQNQALDFRAKAAGFALKSKSKTARLFLIRNVRFFEAVLAFHSEVEKAIALSRIKRNA